EDVVLEGRVEGVVAKKFDIVADADPDLRAEAVPVEETNPDRLEDRYDHIDQEEDQPGREEQPWRETLLVALPESGRRRRGRCRHCRCDAHWNHPLREEGGRPGKGEHARPPARSGDYL